MYLVNFFAGILMLARSVRLRAPLSNSRYMVNRDRVAGHANAVPDAAVLARCDCFYIAQREPPSPRFVAERGYAGVISAYFAEISSAILRIAPTGDFPSKVGRCVRRGASCPRNRP